jgi:outer membrane protein assembly factor BamB
MKPAIETMLILTLLAAAPSHADDWRMLGRNGTRNAVSPEKNPPTFWQIEGVPTKFENQRPIEWTTESKNIKWKADLGINTFGNPVVADGLVWIGTTYKEPDVKRAGLLKCFRERDGKLLYEYRSPVHEDAKDRWTGVPWLGISSTPLVEGDRLWFTSLSSELVCLDIAPLKRGEGQPTMVWKRDMRKEWGVYPWACIMGPGFTGNVAVHEHLLYAITGNGCSYDGPPPAPEAPSLVCLDKRTGELIWQDASPGANILNAQWGSPLVATIDGRAQVIVPQGDGWIRAFNALTGELIWKFDINPKESIWRSGGGGPRNYFMGAPVFHDSRVFIAPGHTPEHGEGVGRLVCIDPARKGDISSELAVDADGNPLPHRRQQAVDPTKGERAIANPNSGLIWEYVQQDRDGNGEIDFEEDFHRTLGSVTIKDGLLVAADFSGLLHCLDAKTGKVHFTLMQK